MPSHLSNPGVWTGGAGRLSVVDSRGATYVAYADGAGAIRLTALQPGGTQWSSPVTVAMEGAGLSAPTLMVVGNALIVGYRDGDGVALHAVPLLDPESVNQVRSIYDGPDPTTGYTSDDDDEKDEQDTPGLEIHGGGVTVRPTGAGSTSDAR